MSENTNSDADIQSIWATCRGLLRSQVSEAVWLTSFRDLLISEITSEKTILTAPSAVIRDRVMNRYLPMVQAALYEAGAQNTYIQIDVTLETNVIADENYVNEMISATPDGSDLQDRLEPVAPASSLLSNRSYTDTINSRYTFDSFVTGTSNRFAHAAALAVAETPGRSYNPLFIHGSAGLGKTHLLQGIVHYIHNTYPNYKARYVSTETFLNEFVEAIKTSTTSIQ